MINSLNNQYILIKNKINEEDKSVPKIRSYLDELYYESE